MNWFTNLIAIFGALLSFGLFYGYLKYLEKKRRIPTMTEIAVSIIVFFLVSIAIVEVGMIVINRFGVVV